MDEPEYLLTYNGGLYEWFYSVDEMREFLEENEIESYEALHIPEAFEVEI